MKATGIDRETRLVGCLQNAAQGTAAGPAGEAFAHPGSRRCAHPARQPPQTDVDLSTSVHAFDRKTMTEHRRHQVINDGSRGMAKLQRESPRRLSDSESANGYSEDAS